MPTFIQPSFAKGEGSPEIDGRVDTAAYQIMLKTARNAIVHAYGGISNRPGTIFIGPVKDHTYAPRLVGFQYKTTDTYMLEFGDLYMRVIRNDSYVFETAKVITGITVASPGVVTSVAHGFTTNDEVRLNDIVGMTRLNGRRFKVVVLTVDTFSLKDQVTGAAISTVGLTAYSSGGTASRVYALVTPYAKADLMALKWVQSADVLTMTAPGYPVQEITRTGHANWTIVAPVFAPSIAAPANPMLTVVGANNSATWTYVITALKAETFEESLPSAEVTTALGTTASDNQVSWDAVSGAAKYSVYKEANGIFGWLGDTEDLLFNDKNMAPDLTITPPKARNPFNAAGEYPGSSGYYEQRRVFGGSINKPDTSFYSQTGNQKNMSSSSPSKADDAITATLNSREVNEIRHFIGGKDLLVFTGGQEWLVNSGQDSAFSATTIKQKPQSSWGCAHHRPIVSGNTIIFVEENNARVRSLGYSLQIDGYTGANLTLLSGHMFADYQITDFSNLHSPDTVAVAVRSDGQLVCMTFEQEQQVTAWSRWDTKGKYERVGSLRHSSTEIDDRLYVVTKRRINGNTVRYIERTHSRRFVDVRDCFFVDCGLSFDNPVVISNVTAANPVVVTAVAHGFSNDDEVELTDIVWASTFDKYDNEIQPDQINNRRFKVANKTADTFELLGIDGTGNAAYVEGGVARKTAITITGLDHLEGEMLAILADGNAVSNLTVSNGSITFARRVARAHIGLKYITDIETMRLETPQGTVQGKMKRIVRVVVRFLKSRGLFIGPTNTKLTEMKQRASEPMGAPTALLTGDHPITLDGGWNTDGRVFLRQRYPLPMTILAIIPYAVFEDPELPSDH